MNLIKIKCKSKNLPLPQYQTTGSAGVDLCADIHETIILESLQRKLIPTGLMLEIPLGFEAQIRPRSGLALKHGITMVNTPGTIDSDYRGEIGVILINLGHEPFRIERGDRIAQMVFAPVVQAQFVLTEELTPTERGQGGFGSTGS